MINKMVIAAGMGICAMLNMGNTLAAPAVTGSPVIVQHLGKMEWPQDDDVSSPYLTQLVHNDINDLHGDLSCDLIISTPGNYHMALKEAMNGVPGVLTGLREQVKTAYNVSVCWSTSPPVGPAQIQAEDLQFKNIHVRGLPALVMGPGAVMNTLLANNLVDASSKDDIFTNRGNVILIRADKANKIKNVCDLGGKTRVVTPHPSLEPGSFGNFSGTIFDVANNYDLGCDATELFNGIFGQDVSLLKLSAFDNPFNIGAILEVFKGNDAPKWLASSRIMHRDIPYALCHDEADAGVIFYHQAIYLKETMAAMGCDLRIVPLGGTESAPAPLQGNKVAPMFIAKVNGSFSQNVLDARDLIYNFMTSSSTWTSILNKYGMDGPKP